MSGAGRRVAARAWCALPLVLCLVPLPAAASPITLTGSTNRVSLVEHVEALPDPTGILQVDEVAGRRFRPMFDVDPGLGRWPGEPQRILWMRFTVRIAPDAGDDWSLVIGRPYDAGNAYVEGEDGQFVSNDLRLDDTGGSARVALPRRSGTYDVYLRVPVPTNLPSVFHVATPAGEERLEQRLLTGQGLYLGVVAAMLLVNLLLGVQLRDRAHLWYVGFLASSAATFSLLTGTVSRFLFPAVPAATLFRPQMACIALMTLAGVQFSRLFLDTPRLAPRADRVMRLYLGLAAAVLVMVCVAPDMLALRAVSLLGLLVPFVALPAGVASLRAGSRWARFYLVGWSVFTLGGFAFAFPVNQTWFDALLFFQLSSAAEAALFSLALVDRMRILRSERVQAEQKVLRAEKLASLGQLVAGVAHEVNNPNNFLTFNLPILQEYLDAVRPHVEGKDVRLVGLSVDEFFADAKKLIGNMQHGTERISGIVSQLRSYVRQDDATQWEEADVNRVVDDAVTLVRAQVQKSVGRFDVRLGEGLPRVRMSPGRIEQVVINLLLNAAHAAGKVPDGRVELRTAREGGHVVITVEDTGPGIPEEIRDRIFEPFFTTKSGEQGTGMGLAISQRIVDEHGGTLELAAAGTTRFSVRLRIVEHT